MIEEIVFKLNKKGIRFSLNGDKLKVSADIEPNQESLNIILQNKTQIIEYIKLRLEDYTAIPKTEELEDYAVSSAQRRLWVLSKFEGANEAYNIPQVVWLGGSINEPAFSSAYNALLKRHEVLRTVFSEDEQGNPRQRILASTEKSFNIDIKDYSHQRKEEIKREINDYVQQEISTGFDLEQGPLVRCSLLKETENSYVWVLVMHHIVSDGWSMGVLHKEFSELYNAALEQRSPALEPLSIQYKDYAAWHNAQLESVDIKLHKEYWLEQFKGELPVLELPSDNLLEKSFEARDISKLLAALTDSKILSNPNYSIVKAPVEWFVGVARYLKLTPSALKTPAQLLAYLDKLAQVPFNPPNVGGWPTDESWLSSASAQSRIQFASWLIKQADLSALTAIAPNKRVAWLQDELGVLPFSNRTRLALDGVKGTPAQLLQLAICSPEYVVSA